MKSVMHNFADSEHINLSRSSFDLSFGHKTTGDVDKLLPLFRYEAMPGETLNVQPNILARFNTLLYPLMDNIDLHIEFFSIPIRQVWANWRKFMGEQIDP